MKKLFFTLLLSLALCSGIFAQANEQSMEVIPTISVSGNQDGWSLDSELIIAKKFSLSKNNKWFLYGQFGAMYNVFETKFSDEWQLGFEPMVGVGTKNFRLSGFLNGLTVKALDTGKMPFVEGGVRFSITPWRKLWVSVFTTWPISNPILINSSYDEYYFENNEGVFLNQTTTEKWAYQEKSYGADINLGIGKKLIVSLDGFAMDENNYQLGTGLQFRLFKHKPWIFGGNVFYTNFENNNYYYIHNIFPGMLGNDMKGYTFKLGISNRGGLGESNFSDQLVKIAQPQYYSPVAWKLEKKSIQTKIGEAFKFDPCVWGGECLDFVGSLCITQGKSPYKIFVDWGDGITESYTVQQMGPWPFKHHYSKEGEYRILISGMDTLGKTYSYTNKFEAKNCINTNECENVEAFFYASRTQVKPGEIVYFTWDVQNAEKATFNEKDVELLVTNYPVVFDTLGTFNYTLKAYNKGKLCVEKTITITVTTCPTAKILSLSANPTEVVNGGSTTISWVINNWKTVTLNGIDVTNLTNENGIGSKTFTNITATTNFILNVGNDCPSSDTASVKVTIINNQCPEATSTAPQGFELPNSSIETETNWVNANVKPGPWIFLYKNDGSTPCAAAQIDASVVLIKAGTKYIYYLNVSAGQQLCSYDGKDISHVSYFTCEI